jgi:GH25 family lysozyme M1 (1,4-beta-N-acetylmuramidase)
MLNRITRQFKKRSIDELKELRNQYEEKFFEEGALAVGYDDEGLVIFTNQNTSKFNFYGESKVKIIKLDAPFRAYSRADKIRPLQGGISIGTKDGTGTLSIIVLDKTTNEPLILSNNHVLAKVNKGQKGDPIYQPGPNDAYDGLHEVGYLERFVPLKNDCNVDCAVAKPTVNVDSGLYQIYPEVREVIEPTVNLNVQKSGRTTDTTYGTILSIGTTVEVFYGSGTYRIKDVFICKLPSAPGDSGSLITTQGSIKKVVGLLFAGNGTYTVGCKFSEVEKQLNIKLMEDIRPVVLDISHYNGKVLDTQKLHNNKVLGVFLKCCQGNYLKDTKFDENWNTLKNANIRVAPYIFVDPKVSAEEHFQYFLQCFGDKEPDFPVALDCEYTNNQPKDKITSVIQNLALKIESWQKEKFPKLNPPIIYTRASWWNEYVLAWSGWKRFGLWVARYGVDQPWLGVADRYKVRDWDEWLLWQYSADENNDGSRYGLESRAVDKNIASEKFIKNYLNPVEVPPPPDYQYRGTVLVSSLNIRSMPTTNANIVGSLKKGELVLILEVIKDAVSNLWVKLGTNQYACARYYNVPYIQIDGYEEPVSNKKGKVLVASLNVRNRPSIQGQIVGGLKRNDIVEIFEEIKVSNSEIWIRIGLDKYCAMVYNNTKYVTYL